MKTMKCFYMTVALVLAVAADAEEPAGQNQPAGGSGFSIDWHTLDSGGTLFAAGGDWTLAGTIGQFDATEHEALAGGDWKLTGGFWAGGDASPSEPVIFRDRFEQ